MLILFNRVEKQIKEKTEKQVDYVYEVINEYVREGITRVGKIN